MHAKMVAVGFLVVLFANPVAKANSYGFTPLGKADIPASIHTLAVWSHFHSHPVAYTVSKESLERFFSKGTYSYEDPYFSERQVYDSEGRSINFIELLKTPVAELTAEGREALATYKKYRWLSELSVEENQWQRSIDGAFTDAYGRIFQFRIQSNRHIEIISGGICHFTLAEEDAIPLEKRGSPTLLDSLPALPTKKLDIVGGRLPGTGLFDVVSEKLLRSFFEDGIITGMTPKERFRHRSTLITTFWMAESRLVKKPLIEIRQFDKAGHGVLDATVNGVFRFDDDSLWSCALFSDALLFVDDGKGGYAVIEHPAAMAAGAGFAGDTVSF